MGRLTGLLLATLAVGCAQAGPDYERDVKFYLITTDYPEGIQVNFSADSFLQNGFNQTQPTTVIIHGYGHDITDELFSNVAGALLDAGVPTNIVAVDWGVLCPMPLYATARLRVGPVGRRVAALLQMLSDADLVRAADVHVIGHSLGGHVAGNVGKATKVARISGLDPAGPLFFDFSDDRLARTDADLVDVIHTCIGLLGYEEPLGHVDFYPNGGHLPQPGCGLLELGHCSHTRAYQLYGESILNRQAFPASYCESATDALWSQCPTGTNDGRMGFHVQYGNEGVYYLRTRDSSPFSYDG